LKASFHIKLSRYVILFSFEIIILQHCHTLNLKTLEFSSLMNELG
jgi:hypothetical protein